MIYQPRFVTYRSQLFQKLLNARNAEDMMERIWQAGFNLGIPEWID
jgi:hypothetical protein